MDSVLRRLMASDACVRRLRPPVAAKFARGLITRILKHGEAKSYWRPGSLIADMFAGVGCGGIVAAYLGYPWLGVELEPRFVALAERNFELHRRKWEALGVVQPRILRGDSRRLSAVLSEAGAIVASPPFAGITPTAGDPKYAWKFHGDQSTYGSSPGQIGRLPAGDVAGILSSPPYVSGGHHADQTGAWGGQAQSVPKELAGYGETPGQIGRLPAGDVSAVVSSPPYARSLLPDMNDAEKYAASEARYKAKHPGIKRPNNAAMVYGSTEGNMGNMPNETYFSACAQVYRECLKVLRPGGVMALVLKGYIRNGILVDLPEQTWQLLLSLGFQPLERIRAMLTKTHRHKGLFGDEIVKKTERKSFFRRLHESRPGAVKIDYESVLFVRKP